MSPEDKLFEKGGVVSTNALKSFLIDLSLLPALLCHKGISAGFKRLVQLSGKAIYQRGEYLLMSKLLSPETETAGRIQDIRIIRLSGQNDLARLETIANSFEARFFKNTIGIGELGFAAYKENEVVGFAWFHPPTLRRIVFFQPSLRPDEVYAHDFFVSPVHRGQGIAQKMMLESFSRIRDLGFKRISCLIAVDNMSSLKAHEKVGYVLIGRVRHRRILLWNSVRTYDCR